MPAIRDFEDLERRARSLPPVTVAVAGAEDGEVVDGVLHAVRAGVARARLVGEASRVAALLAERGAERDDRVDVVAASGFEEAASLAVEIVARGEADVLLQGMVATGELLRKVLSGKAGLRAPGALLSDVLVCPNPFQKYVAPLLLALLSRRAPSRPC
jgi:phosphate butyryltransferase